MSFDPAHQQGHARVRFAWGPTGAAACPADVAVVVDVLSFTTTVEVAVSRGMSVLPYPWRDSGTAAFAADQGAELAVGRLEADASGLDSAVSLSPARMLSVTGVDRVVLPSPNGSSIAFALVESGAEVVAACLRNAPAVAVYLAERLASGAGVTVVAAGERWPDDSLRPADEDLWGAGAVLASLLSLEVGAGELSIEAVGAISAYSSVYDDLAAALRDCASGRELIAKGFADDVEIAAAVDVSQTVPVLREGVFAAAISPRS